MPEFLLLMREDASGGDAAGDWDRYIDALGKGGHLRGGSSLGTGICARKDGQQVAIDHRLTGFLRIEAASIAVVQDLLKGNPAYEAGGTIEIRELVPD